MAGLEIFMIGFLTASKLAFNTQLCARKVCIFPILNLERLLEALADKKNVLCSISYLNLERLLEALADGFCSASYFEPWEVTGSLSR